MIERGRLEGVRGRLLSVQLEMTEACGGCANEGCKKARRSVQAYNRLDLALAPGDEVEIEVEGAAQVVGAAWVFGLPLALLFLAYFAGRRAFPGPSEGPAVLCALAGLALGMTAGGLVQRRNRIKSLPTALRKLEGGAGLGESWPSS